LKGGEKCLSMLDVAWRAWLGGLYRICGGLSDVLQPGTLHPLNPLLTHVAAYAKGVRESGGVLEVGPLYRDSEHTGSQLCNSWGCGAASTNLAFLPEGQITGCSALAMLLPRFPVLLLGDVMRGLDGDAVTQLLSLAQAGPEHRLKCQKCSAATDCAGGCLAINYAESSSAFLPPDFYCQTISAIPKAWATLWG